MLVSQRDNAKAINWVAGIGLVKLELYISSSQIEKYYYFHSIAEAVIADFKDGQQTQQYHLHRESKKYFSILLTIITFKINFTCFQSVAICFLCGVQAGTPLVGYGGNTFNEIFSTGFQNGLGGYGAG